DGIMALFGVPQPLDGPERVALETAREMLARLKEVNALVRARGLEPIRIGIGLHSGEAVVGHVGSDTRHEYTAIGDVVNVASRLEGLTKEVGHPIVCSAAVASAIGNHAGLADLGELSIKGHSTMRVYGFIEREQESGNAEKTAAAGDPTLGVMT
ncbi:MAG TPA: adenylate/guanylate cyclase domain-containing protein, partial [Acidobacteriota bacterium]|nr:adenylate/guanylate cyclase domain-containing protein [Acidobacteriota bacterium]